MQRVGTIGVIQKMLKVPDGTLRCIVAGQQVFKIEQFTQVSPYMVAAYTRTAQTQPSKTKSSSRCSATSRASSRSSSLICRKRRARWRWRSPILPTRVVLTYFVASTMRLETADRQALLEERDTAKRMRKLTLLLTKELEVVELGS